MNNERLRRLQDLLVEARVAGLVVSALPNIRYLTGFTGSNALLLVTREDALFLTDGRYAIQAAREVQGARVSVPGGSLVRALIASINRRRLKSLGFESKRASFELYQALHAGLKACRLRPLAGLPERLRAVKSPEEIATIRRSVHVNSAAFEKSIPEIRNGRTEAELAAIIEYQMHALGGEKPAFETIVASGSRSALPHARPTDKPLQKKQLIIVDQGVILDGYSSDMTRTVAVGALGSRARRVYKAVLEAQLAAISAVRAGVPADKVDRAARSVLDKYGLAEAFVHSTGHGVGLEIHEAPRLGKNDKTLLESGMVITIEPGAYLEDLGGVRIEDMVLVKANGCEVLTPTSKDLRIL